MDAGKIVSADFDTRKQTVTLRLAPATKYVSDARLRVRETEAGAVGWTVVSAGGMDAGETVVPLSSGETAVVLRPASK
jgi:hypothetical protein